MSASDWPVKVHPVWGCWEWIGALDRDGYPIVWLGKRPSRGIRIVWEAEVGPIAEGLVLSHECQNRRCCNPLHLEPVTQRENLLRRSFAYRCRRKQCVRGHRMELTIVTQWGGRLCRVCAREARGG
jgi:hypothetical protein